MARAVVALALVMALFIHKIYNAGCCRKYIQIVQPQGRGLSRQNLSQKLGLYIYPPSKAFVEDSGLYDEKERASGAPPHAGPSKGPIWGCGGRGSLYASTQYCRECISSPPQSSCTRSSLCWSYFPLAALFWAWTRMTTTEAVRTRADARTRRTHTVLGMKVRSE